MGCTSCCPDRAQTACEEAAPVSGSFFAKVINLIAIYIILQFLVQLICAVACNGPDGADC